MEVFVFGSNLAGRHGKGAALYARINCGAIYGQGEGLQGSSYAIPTKDRSIKSLPLDEIKSGVVRFLEFAKAHAEMKFVVTRIGCGLAGYTDEQIGPFFSNSPHNCTLPKEWTK